MKMMNSYICLVGVEVNSRYTRYSIISADLPKVIELALATFMFSLLAHEYFTRKVHKRKRIQKPWCSAAFYLMHRKRKRHNRVTPHIIHLAIPKPLPVTQIPLTLLQSHGLSTPRFVQFNLSNKKQSHFPPLWRTVGTPLQSSYR